MRERVGRVEGKIAIVTGAGSVPGPGTGTGKAISIALAREGAKLVLVDLYPERAEETKAAIEAEGGEAIVVKADCTKWRDCSDMVLKALDAYGRIDILVNNLGLASPGVVTEMYERDWDRVFDINLRTVFLACKYTIPVMLGQQSGAVINLSSMSAQRPGRTIAYSAAKAEVEAMTFDMAYAYGRKGVRVNCVLPGNITTPIATNVLKSFPGHERMTKMREKCGMLGTPGDAWDIAHAVVYLASDEARWVTGVTLPVDAGMLRTTGMSFVADIRAAVEEELNEEVEPMAGGEAETVSGGRLVTRELAEWVASLRYEDLPADVAAEAGRALVDFLGECLFVGGTKPLGQQIAQFCAVNGGGQPEATIIALGTKTLVSRAALANGTMALGFEYADYGAGSRPYPFSVNGPLCLAEFRKLSGKQLALAIVVGYEVMWRTFRGMHPAGHTGFYTPAVYGTLGSGAACAKLLDLDTDHTQAAINFAAGLTGGSFQGHEEGSWQRCLNGGIAGERGVTAAMLAESGYQASKMGLEGIQGFAASFGDKTIRCDAMFEGLGESFIITQRWVKAYPMNTTLHAPTEALLKVMADNNLHHSEIVEISAAWQKVEPFLAKHKVSTVVSAQASLPFALAMAAVRRKVTIDEFTDETVNDPDIQGLIPKVTVTQDLELYQRVKNSMPGRVTVRTKDGREFTDEVLYPRGNPSNPLSEAEFKHKFMEMAERVLGHDQADELYTRAIALTDIADVSELAPLFARK